MLNDTHGIHVHFNVFQSCKLNMHTDTYNFIYNK